MSPDQRGLVHGLRSRGHAQVATWNIAAVNNNPFEYWITHDDAQYNELMKRVQVWPVATKTGVLKIRRACGSESRSDARQCEFALTV